MVEGRIFLEVKEDKEVKGDKDDRKLLIGAFAPLKVHFVHANGLRR